MGNICSAQGEGSKTNHNIEVQIEKERKKKHNEVKLLLLGAGESGKSTISKQMKIIHQAGYSADERKEVKPTITSNILDNMKILLESMGRLGMTIDPSNAEAASMIKELTSLHASVTSDHWNDLTEEQGKKIKDLWQDPSVKLAMKRASEFSTLPDSAPYFFDNIDRMTAPGYVPTDQDILHTRVMTRGVHETIFEVGKIKFRLVDVGGQRSERKKWLSCFEDVTAVVFCVALSEYDLLLFEDNSTNRMLESLKVFSDVCNSWFVNTPIILFLNKSDLFREKIKTVDLSETFPEYRGGKDFDKASSYIKERFWQINKNENKSIYSHITCATDTNNIRVVFEAVKDIIFTQCIMKAGLYS
ncbi:G-protein subunit alpha 2 [Tieghemostelium lacteum]|uniref:G-protein subunit alpha 2 n=1 Tax=Tieghemostelium lacteum TaxID=361077 RepID=A0A152A893_TIELA|nr:G-protein subunit alpha 2 [Tieghemostelium lacteum]|eukprot:KYR02459.1 G-protein subunit alpha 2 [Tieghemostelium lacteum]